jgi:hypothetical protein
MMQHQETWAEWLKGFYFFLGAFLPSVTTVYLLGVKFLDAWTVRIKERSVGETKVKHLVEEMEELKKAHEATKVVGHDVIRRVVDLEGDIKMLHADLRENYQQSINILMKGK